mgnify:CR=1 FL=1
MNKSNKCTIVATLRLDFGPTYTGVADVVSVTVIHELSFVRCWQAEGCVTTISNSCLSTGVVSIDYAAHKCNSSY